MTSKPPSRWQWFKADLYALFNPSEQCIHRSHRWGLKCRRGWMSDRRCGLHVHCEPGNPGHDREATR